MPMSAVFASATTATSTGAVDSMHDSFTALRRRAGDRQHDARRGRARRHRLRPLRDAHRRHRGGVRRRAHGRPDAGVPRQEDRRPRDEAGLALHPHHAGPRAARRSASRWRPRRAASSILNPGAHGLSEVLYAFASASNNNGSAFAGLDANTDFYNVALAVAMALGRFLPICFVLALAGSLAAAGHDARRPPGRCPPTAARSSASSSAWSSSSPASPSSRPSRSARSRKDCHDRRHARSPGASARHRRRRRLRRPRAASRRCPQALRKLDPRHHVAHAR